jgi:hypothetical protein
MKTMFYCQVELVETCVIILSLRQAQADTTY